ncbi:unnamed protein product [Knipowitschia caucasica]
MKPKHNKGTVKDADKGALIQGSTTCASQTTRAKPFTGKVFYLDLTSNKVAETLEDNIKLLGGTVEKFFSKEIKYLVTNKREAKYVHCLRQDSPVPSPESGPSSPQLCSNPHQPQSLGDGSKSSAQLQKQMAAISRGKTLVKKVVKEQERIQMNKILSNALEWGVKILYLDDVISYVHKKKKGISCQQPAPSVVKTNMKNESTKCGFQKSKAGRIGKPFIKVEDSSRHYRPFYLRLTNAPEFNLTSLPPCTPFCLEDKEVVANGTHCQRVAKASASDERPNERKKKKQGGFCECCLVKYENITTHLQSDRHKTFAKSDKYLVVDKLVSAMPCNFNRSKIKRPKCSVSSVLIAPGPCVETKSRHEDGVDSKAKLDLDQFCLNSKRTEGLCSGPASTATSVLRTKKRRKAFAFLDTRHNPKRFATSSSQERGHLTMGELASPAGDIAVAQLSSQDTPAAGNVKREPETLHETKSERLTNLQAPPLALAHISTENVVSLKEGSSEAFVRKDKIKRKIKVYKRTRQRFSIEDAVSDSLMRLWELFQDSDEMDVEFYGFE